MIVDTNTRLLHSLDQLGPDLARRLRTGDGTPAVASSGAAGGSTGGPTGASSSGYAPGTVWRNLDAGPGAHEQAMDCVDASVVLGLRAGLIDAHVPAEFIAEYVRRDPRRRFGVAGVDPLPGDGPEQVDAAVELGMVGIAVSPAAQGCHPTHSAAMDLYERCRLRGMTLFVADPFPLPSSAMAEFGRPLHWDEVARTFPDLRIVFTRLGAPWVDETLMLVAKHRYVFAEVSGFASSPWALYHALQQAMVYGAMHRLLLGSGFPFETPAGAIEAILSVNALTQGTPLPSVPRSLLRGIVERPVPELLGFVTPGDEPADAARSGAGIPRAASALGRSAIRTGAGAAPAVLIPPPAGSAPGAAPSDSGRDEGERSTGERITR
ncbi:MAG: amidohydrolase family protein [Phycisphaeraceae bacterium]|nr:amidohydrolase family protein [Phycisphaeraceae bacterium]